MIKEFPYSLTYRDPLGVVRSLHRSDAYTLVFDAVDEDISGGELRFNGEEVSQDEYRLLSDLYSFGSISPEADSWLLDKVLRAQLTKEAYSVFLKRRADKGIEWDSGVHPDTATRAALPAGCLLLVSPFGGEEDLKTSEALLLASLGWHWDGNMDKWVFALEIDK